MNITVRAGKVDKNMRSFVSFPCFLPELWSLHCPKMYICCNFVLTSERNLSLLSNLHLCIWKLFSTKLENSVCKIYIHVVSLGSNLMCKISQFFGKSYRFGQVIAFIMITLSILLPEPNTYLWRLIR